MIPHKHFKNPDDQQSGPNCGVTATAICAGVSFRKAWNTFKTLGTPYYAKKNWKGATMRFDQSRALDKLDIEYSKLPKMMDCHGKTLNHFCEYWAMEDGVYMVTTTSHVQTVMVKNDKAYVIDQRGAKPIGEYWGRRKRVKQVIEIKTPFKHAEQAQAKPKAAPKPEANPIIIQPHSGASLFPSLFPQQASAEHGQQLSLF